MLFYELLKKPFFSRYMVEWRNPLQENERSVWTAVSTKSKSGATIKGLFANSVGGNQKATIVMGHPMGKEAKGYFLKNGYTDLLRDHGYNVLVFDINGFGESTHGNFSYFEDIIAIGQKAKELSGNVPVGYFGISLGGQWAIISFTDKSHPYEFAIIESAATTLDEFWKNYPFAYAALKVLNTLMPAYRKQISMIDRVKETMGLKSILFIYSHADRLTPVSMGERYTENCNVPSSLLTLSNAGHAAIMKSPDKDFYMMKIIEYLNTVITLKN